MAVHRLEMLGSEQRWGFHILGIFGYLVNQLCCHQEMRLSSEVSLGGSGPALPSTLSYWPDSNAGEKTFRILETLCEGKRKLKRSEPGGSGGNPPGKPDDLLA
jgi:hypothetical protein